MTTHLPETHRTPEGLREALTSAQLQQSMNSLTQAIHSDQLPVLLSGLGLNSGAVLTAQPGTDALEVLCRAMDSQNGGGGTGEVSDKFRKRKEQYLASLGIKRK